MPKELRKRGKKKLKQQDQDHSGETRGPTSFSETQAEPGQTTQADPDAPFGIVEPNLKSYIYTIEAQLREWNNGEATYEYSDTMRPLEERTAFITSVLAEISGKEPQLATDPRCSAVLERLCYSMDDLARRTFMERLADSWVQLSKHRFASHVCQTALELACHTVSREHSGKFAMFAFSEQKSMTDIILDAAKELIDPLCELMMDQFASHVIRAMLKVLDPSSCVGGDAKSSHNSYSRSKKSEAFRQRQGSMMSVFHRREETSSPYQVPNSFGEMAGRYGETLRQSLGNNEVRAMVINPVASPILQMLLAIESKRGESEVPGSLMDRVLVGMVTRLLNQDRTIIREDYIEALLKDATSSHLMEVLVEISPPQIFHQIWATYFVGRLGQYITHPIVNFVVAKAVSRIDNEDHLRGLLAEAKGGWARSISLGRIGTIRALVERSTSLGVLEEKIIETIISSFGITKEDDQQFIIPCILHLKTLEAYHASQASQNQPENEPSGLEQPPQRKEGRPNDSKFSTQGALLLQSMLRVHAPFNASVLESLRMQSADVIIEIAHDPTGSRVLDVVLEAPRVPYPARRNFIMSLLGKYHILIDDRLGSRVADRCWDASDARLKRKIAESLIPHEYFLAQSIYGRHFAKKIRITLFQRNKSLWVSQQSLGPPRGTSQQLFTDESTAQDHREDQQEVGLGSPKKRKRMDEIDEIFSTVKRQPKNGS
ncbi:armadillo-type protein [Cantharellus anzutake]|uniref:armadillo-type protein n=1 Tax=Cantharellus anzutake TaxID=1750568 RepID=UPI0019065058|nr:armadillo-type protein [Cantharellus anzutake]KAF8339196.1 armadillo-type protein [Cantharellus anzutake]